MTGGNEERLLPREAIEDEGLACSCDAQQPVRRLVEYGSTMLSLLFCASCGGLILEERRPDELAAMRQDVAALRRIVGELFEQAEPGLSAGREAGPPFPGPLRVLPGGKQSRRP